MSKDQSVVIVLAGADRIIKHANAVHMLESWKEKDVNVTYFTKRALTHGMAIGWYSQHLGELLDRTEVAER